MAHYAAGTGLTQHEFKEEEPETTLEEFHDQLDYMSGLMHKIEERTKTLENILNAIQKLLASMTAPLPPKTIWEPENGHGALSLVQSHLESLNFVQ